MNIAAVTGPAWGTLRNQERWAGGVSLPSGCGTASCALSVCRGKGAEEGNVDTPHDDIRALVRLGVEQGTSGR